MKAATALLTLLLASQALPIAIQSVQAQTANAMSPQAEDRSDGTAMQLEYSIANRYAYASIPAYSAEEVTDKNRTLADGNQIKSQQTGMRYRDQNGRMRRDFKSYAGKDRIFIADPRARVAYLIRPDRQDVLRIKGAAPQFTPIIDLARTPTRAPGWNKQVTTSLGLKDIDGLKAAGTLIESFYPAGAMGNEKDMVETRETWRSNQFPNYLYSRTVTPRDGETIVHLENLKFGDVPASLFAIPTDYTIRDLVLDAAPAGE